MPKIPKTNIGQKLTRQEEHIKQGSPTRDKSIENYGTIIDINYPGINELNADPSSAIEGSDIRVRILFDKPLPGNQVDSASGKSLEAARKDWWFKVDNKSMDEIIGIDGNRDAIIAKGTRVKLTHPPYEWRGGVAHIICDNTQGKVYKKYQKNRSNNVVGVFSSLAFNISPPGY